MGCFLIITKRDFAQLSEGMRQALNVSTASSSATVRVQVDATAYHSAREMAAIIRRHAPNTQVTYAASGERFVATIERDIHTVEVLTAVDPFLGQVYNSALQGNIRSDIGAHYLSRGKTGERVAAQILEQHENLIIHKERIARAQGVDVPGRSHYGGAVVAEVKTSASDKDFSRLLGKGYGHRQCSDGWLEALNVDPAQTKVMGVHINPNTLTVSIYRRVDPDARVWKCVARNLPLSDFDIDPNY